MINHFISLASFSHTDLSSLIERAQFFSLHQNHPEKFQDILKHKIFVNAFYEPSTRTRCSFEIAAKRLGAEVVNFSPENSSVKKGETVYDTLKTFESLGANAIILRHSDDHILDELKDKFKVPLINAGAGKNEHPSQGLLDLLTIQQEFKKLEGLKVAVCGDIKHSRVAGSLMVLAKKFGFTLYHCGPDSLLPSGGNRVLLDDILPEVDALMMLRIQLERHDMNLNAESYHQQFGLDLKRLSKMQKHAIILHPGPFNRGIELSDEIVEHPQSRIFNQVSNGVFTRMAVLEWAVNMRSA